MEKTSRKIEYIKAGTKGNIKQGQKAWEIPGRGNVAGHFLVITFFLN